MNFLKENFTKVGISVDVGTFDKGKTALFTKKNIDKIK